MEEARDYEAEIRERIRDLKIGDVSSMWIDYDKQNDILYIGFGREEAEESILLDDDIVVAIRGDRIVGITVMDFAKRVGLK
ncbi:MAG: DUF2283 domain-containing protein [Desulfurococcales archaeon]|nr:DUF2283 domain-containing protein [Desulfurococcales archaeon]